jgi:DNA-binding MarR family transcriptional regulator
MKKEVDIVNKVPFVTEDDVLELIHAVMHQVRSRQGRPGADGRPAVAHLEGKVIHFFARHPGATPSDLVLHAGRDKGQVARLLAVMKEKGLLESIADEKDRRVVRYVLTETAQDLLADVKRQRQQLSRQAVAGFSPQQKQQLLELLRQVQNNLRD